MTDGTVLVEQSTDTGSSWSMMPKLQRALWLVIRLLTSAVIEPSSASLASDSDVYNHLFIWGPSGLECDFVTNQVMLLQTNLTSLS